MKRCTWCKKPVENPVYTTVTITQEWIEGQSLHKKLRLCLNCRTTLVKYVREAIDEAWFDCV